MQDQEKAYAEVFGAFARKKVVVRTLAALLRLADDARTELQTRAGLDFDPDVVAAFLEIEPVEITPVP